jgi:hypothetical protein
MPELSQILLAHLPAPLQSVHQYSSSAEIVTEIKKNSVTRTGKRLSNDSSEAIRLGDLELEFFYKREDLRIKNPHAVSAAFGMDETAPYRPYLLNSGQAGINLVMQHLQASTGLRDIAIATTPYIGTKELAQRCGLDLSPVRSSTSPLLWICSSNLQQHDLECILAGPAGRFSHLIIDTTCWHQNAGVVSDIVAATKPRHTYLIRSLSKLDMAGIEYGSLGSLAVMSEDLAALDGDLQALIKLTGAAPSLDDIPPYLFTQRFQQYLLRRTKELAQVTRRIQAGLAASVVPEGLRLYFPPHGQYFFLYFSRQHFPDEPKLQQLAQKLLFFKEVPATVMASFGFDHCVLSPILNDESERYSILRLAPGRAPQRADRVGEAIQLLFQRLAEPA